MADRVVGQRPRPAPGNAGARLGLWASNLLREIDGSVPESLSAWWEPNMYCLHSASWWHSHWKKAGIVDVELADSMPEGWQFWLQWQAVVAPENLVEIRAVESDAGTNLGYVRAVGRRRRDAKLDEIIQSIPRTYNPQPLLRPT